MSAQGATALYERVTSDEQFRAQLEAAATPEEKRRIVTDAGYDMSRDDLSTIRNLAGMNELSDEDLERVAGGIGMETSMEGGIPVVVGAMSAAALV
jgi:predicted ribosomally synthesized peptide with nif11-like leader